MLRFRIPVIVWYSIPQRTKYYTDTVTDKSERIGTHVIFPGTQPNRLKRSPETASALHGRVDLPVATRYLSPRYMQAYYTFAII